jgi:hypothetical protein
VGSVSDQQQAGSVPTSKARRLDGKERALVPVAQCIGAIGQPWHSSRDDHSEGVEALAAQARVAALSDRAANLPLSVAVV